MDQRKINPVTTTDEFLKIIHDELVRIRKTMEEESNQSRIDEPEIPEPETGSEKIWDKQAEQSDSLNADQWKCDECGKVFQKELGLKVHKKKKHGIYL